MTILTRTLNALGLMTRAEHEAMKSGFLRDIKAERDKFKAASRDLASLVFQIEELTPDALAMRRKRQMDRDRRKGRG